MENNFRVSRFASLFLILSFFSTASFAASLCSWLFSSKTLIINYSREVSNKPHSAYFIGQNIREDNLRTTLEEISGIKASMLVYLIGALKSPPPTYERIFGTHWGVMQSTPFFTHPVLKQRLLDELVDLKNHIVTATRELQSSNTTIHVEAPHVVNVITEIQGSMYPDSIIEVTAHYDTVPPSPGADDNGSGVSTMLEMIRVFKRFPPERTLRFIFTDLEEDGMQGSQLHAKNIIAKNERILSTLVIDTIGYHPYRHDGSLPGYVLELGTRAMHKSDYSFQQTKALVEAIAWQSNRYRRNVRYSVQFENALPGTADHGSYLELGLPAALAAAGFHGELINPGYHKSTDTIENYNWPFFLSIVRVLTESLAVVSGARVSDLEYQNLIQTTEINGIPQIDPNAQNEVLLRTVRLNGFPSPSAVKSQEPQAETIKRKKGLFQTLTQLFLFKRD